MDRTKFRSAVDEATIPVDNLERLVVSAALVEEARSRDDLGVVREPGELTFEDGRLPPFPTG